MAKIQIRKRNNTYSYRFEIPTSDGTRKRREKGGFKTERQAYTAGIKAYHTYLNDEVTDKSKLTVEGLLDEWLNQVKVHDLKESTFHQYSVTINRYILPYLKDKQIAKLTPAAVTTWLNALVEYGLAHSTIHKALVILTSSLNYAADRANYISKNPALNCEVPKQAKKGIVKRTIIRQDLLDRLFSECEQDPTLTVPLMLLYHTGMRIGEVMGLTWDCIDFENRTIRVEKQNYPNSTAHRPQITTLKTAASYRELYFDNELADFLQKWQLEQTDILLDGAMITYVDKDGMLYSQSQELKPKNGWKLIEMVCTTRKGTPTHRSVVQEFLKGYGLNTHSFRHTHATLLIEAGATPKGVAGRLGHTKVGITQDLYTHGTDKMKRDVVDVFENVLSKR